MARVKNDSRTPMIVKLHVHFHFQTEVGPIFSLTNLPWNGSFCNSNPIGGGLEESS
jgi:hypothetical protein